MATKAKSHKPDRLHTVSAHLIVRGAEEAIRWYQKALGAELLNKSPGPGGKLMHVELQFGDTVVMMADEFPEMGSKAPPTIGGSAVVMHLAVPDTDKAYARATEAGAQGTMPPADMFWGDRYARFVDPFGHQWALLTHLEDLSYEEMEKRGQEWMASMGSGKPA